MRVNESQEGVNIEKKLANMFEEKIVPQQEFSLAYTNRKDGVLPGYNIRTDRFEVARVAKEKLNKHEAEKIAKREAKAAVEEKKGEEKPE